jgi:hypothetical protein
MAWQNSFDMGMSLAHKHDGAWSRQPKKETAEAEMVIPDCQNANRSFFGTSVTNP